MLISTMILVNRDIADGTRMGKQTVCVQLRNIRRERKEVNENIVQFEKLWVSDGTSGIENTKSGRQRSLAQDPLPAPTHPPLEERKGRRRHFLGKPPDGTTTTKPSQK